MASPIITLRNIHKTYLLGVEGVPALRGINLEIFKGEWVVIYGTSGGGKTSLLNLIGTIDKPTRGEIEICGVKINSNTSDDTLAELRLNHIGFVFQAFNLLGNMSASENVELPMILKGELNREKRANKINQSLEKVGMLHRINQFPNQLSGGEQQRVTIARSIANDPEILLLDEPTGDLDTVNTHKAIQLLYDLNKSGMTMVMVTHDVYLKNFANRVIYMRDGKVVREEQIDASIREKAFEDLKSDILHQHKLVDTAISVHSKRPGETDKSEMRMPKDYDILQGSCYDNYTVRRSAVLLE